MLKYYLRRLIKIAKTSSPTTPPLAKESTKAVILSTTLRPKKSPKSKAPTTPKPNNPVTTLVRFQTSSFIILNALSIISHYGWYGVNLHIRP